MAGLLAYAAEGAVAGAGAGIADVGATNLKAQVEQGLQRLQNNYATARQNAGFAHEEGMQAKNQTFEKGLKEEEIGATSATAAAARTERAEQAHEHETHADSRTSMIAGAKKYAADKSAEARTAAGKAPKPWQKGSVKVYAKNPDGSSNYMAPAEDKPVVFNPNNGGMYASEEGGRLVRWNTSKGAPNVDPRIWKTRKPVDQGTMDRLFQDPNGVIPPGHKGSGMTNAENFERVHGYLPAAIMSHISQGGMVNENNPDAAGSEAEADAPDPELDAEQERQTREDNEVAVEPKGSSGISPNTD